MHKLVYLYILFLYYGQVCTLLQILFSSECFGSSMLPRVSLSFFFCMYILYMYFFFIFVPTLSTIMLTRDSVVLVSRAAIATHHKVGGSDQQKLSLSSGGQKFKIKVLVMPHSLQRL